MSSAYALSQDFWQQSEDADRRFRRWCIALGLPALILGIVIPFLQLAGLVAGGGIPDALRYAQLLEQKQAPPAAQPEEPKPAEEKLPEEVKPQEAKPQPKEVVKPKPVPKQEVVEKPKPDPAQVQEAARQKAAKMMSWTSALSDLKDRSLPQITSAQPLTSGVVTSSAGGSPNPTTMASAAAATSGGIGNTDVQRSQSSTGVGERRTASVSGPQGLGPDKSKPGQAGMALKSGRTLEEIQLVFDRNKGSIYTIYNRALRENASLQGKLLINLTIAPSGRVVRCDVVSNELGDPELARKVIARVMLLDFGAKDVETITLDYPIYFLPS